MPNCKDAVAAKRINDFPNRVRLLEQLGVHQISVLEVAGVYLLVLSIDSRVLNGFWSLVISDGTFADDSWLVVRTRLTFSGWARLPSAGSCKPLAGNMANYLTRRCRLIAILAR